MTFRRVVTAVQALALLASAAFVLLLFVEAPTGTKAPAAQRVSTLPGQAVFATQCAKCHGARGQGGLGPQLAGGRVVERFPNVADQVEVVSEGRGRMPAFGASLTADQIAAVVAYTRTGL